MLSEKTSLKLRLDRPKHWLRKLSKRLTETLRLLKKRNFLKLKKRFIDYVLRVKEKTKKEETKYRNMKREFYRKRRLLIGKCNL